MGLGKRGVGEGGIKGTLHIYEAVDHQEFRMQGKRKRGKGVLDFKSVDCKI